MAKTTDFFERFSRGILRAAERFCAQPYDVTPAQFWTVAGESVNEWEVRRLGGFTGIRDTQFPPPPKAVKSVLPRQGQTTVSSFVPLENFVVHPVDLQETFRLAKLKQTDILRIVVQPDTHVPEHDTNAFTSFLSFLRFYKPHGLINLGDFLEMNPVSRWDAHSAAPRRLIPEIVQARSLLREIDKAAGPQCVLKRFLIGNHESWLEQHLVGQIPELYDGIAELGIDLRIQDLLELKDFGYRVIPLNEILQVGHMHFIHGYYTGKYHAAKHLEVFGVNLMYGHVHDVQQFSGVSVKGIFSASSLGCLRTLNAPFLRGKPNNWVHAFGILEFRSDGTFTQYIPIMVNGRFTYNGTQF